MTLAAFPADKIPHQPAPDGLTIEFANLSGRTEMEIGPARQRRIAGTGAHFVRLPLEYTNGQYEYFRAWLEHGINAGADPFTIDLFLGSDYTADVEARLVKAATQPKRQDGGWRVETRLELGDLPAISSEALDAIIGAAGGGLPEWPTQLLANPLNDDFAHVLPDPLLRGDEGPVAPDQARFVTNMPAKLAFSWPLVWDDFETFKGWLKWRLAWGRKWFTLPVFRGAAYVTCTGRFVAGSLSATREGPEWLVKGEIELRDLPMLSLADAEALL